MIIRVLGPNFDSKIWDHLEPAAPIGGQREAAEQVDGGDFEERRSGQRLRKAEARFQEGGGRTGKNASGHPGQGAWKSFYLIFQLNFEFYGNDLM